VPDGRHDPRAAGSASSGTSAGSAARALGSKESAGSRENGPLNSAESNIGRFRWVICAILFLGVTKNYMDRQLLGVLKTTLQHDLGWNEIDYGNLVSAFQVAYAFGLVVVGRWIDRVGSRWGYAAAMVFWSIASMAHAAGSSLWSFFAARSALGFGESGVFPASMKAVAEWFPRKERALATGIFNAGTSVGAIVTPLLVPWITIHYGWRAAFVFTGALGFAWVLLWLGVYQKPEEHPRCSKEEFDFIRRDPIQPAKKVAWADLLTYRQTWAYVTAKFLTDPIWWFFLFWAPDFLQREHGLRLSQIGLPLVVIYTISDVGSVLGGWFSSFLIRAGISVNASRKSALLASAVCVVPVMAAYRVSSLWEATLLIGLAVAGHQGFSANLLTLSSDLFPAEAVGSVVGIGGMAGALGGMVIAKIVGNVLQWSGSYMVPFLIAGSAYLAALACIQILSPRLEAANLERGPESA